MEAADRRALILSEVGQRGVVRVGELSARLGVSAVTIRRDLDALTLGHRLHRVHGGATDTDWTIGGVADHEGTGIPRLDEKAAIAEAAAAMIEPGSAVGLSAGTTTRMLARRLSGIAGLTVVTNSPLVARTLGAAGLDAGRVVLTGGTVMTPDVLAGPLAVAAFERLHLDIAFLGVHGVDPRRGLTCADVVAADTDRALVRAGRRLVVLADHSKWRRVGVSTVATLRAADAVVMGEELAPPARRVLADQVGDVVLVSGGSIRVGRGAGAI